MKVTYSTENINPMGGINFADRIIGNANVYKIIDQALGSRGVKAIYRYSDQHQHAHEPFDVGTAGTYRTVVIADKGLYFRL